MDSVICILQYHRKALSKGVIYAYSSTLGSIKYHWCSSPTLIEKW